VFSTKLQKLVRQKYRLYAWFLNFVLDPAFPFSGKFCPAIRAKVVQLLRLFSAWIFLPLKQPSARAISVETLMRAISE
jgi:hypothetical protein